MVDRPIRISIKTTGCKVNQADTALIVEGLSGLPIHWVGPGSESDISIVNACTVTRAAERDGRNAVYRASRSSVGPVYLTGCMAVRLARDSEPSGFEERVRVIPSSGDRSGFITGLREEILRLTPDAPAPEVPTQADGWKGHVRSRPIVKVQDGCNGSCTYCIVPSVRGPSSSVPASSVARDVRRLAESGASEIVLAGVDLSSWGRDNGDATCLADLLDTLVNLGTGMRFRLSSMEPDGLDDRVLHRVGSSGDLCRHLHVPMQSGSDGILDRMKRPYRSTDFAAVIDRAHDRIDGLSLGLDVLCGFPGEDDAAFEETHSFLLSLPFTYLHVFPYSPRPGTPAYDLGDDVSPAVKKERCAILRALSDRRRLLHASNRIDTTAEVVDIRLRDGIGVESLAGDYTRVIRSEAHTVRKGRFQVPITGSQGPMALSGRNHP